MHATLLTLRRQPERQKRANWRLGLPTVMLTAVGLIAVSSARAPIAAASTAGDAAVAQVNEAGYIDFLNTWLYTHLEDDRGLYGEEHDLARDNIETLFQGFGLPVSLHSGSYPGGTYYNVVATMTGMTHPDQIYIVGAHYDSAGTPGADAGASGVALLLEAARILAPYDATFTIRFIAFDRTIQELAGSTAYAQDHAGDDILGMIMADSIGYDTDTNHARIHGTAASSYITSGLADAITSYGDGLTCTVGAPLYSYDHWPFEDVGFRACLLIEGEAAFNPHRGWDSDAFETPDYLDPAYAVKMIRSVVGFLVDHAEINVEEFVYPDGRPIFIAPEGGTLMRVWVRSLDGLDPQPGTGLLHYDAGAGFETVAMDVVSENVYDAVFPSTDCGVELQYYVSAEAVGGGVFTDPPDAPATVFSVTAADDLVTLFEDDCETDTGWTIGDVDDDATAGIWNRADPEGTQNPYGRVAQPEDDHTPDPGIECWATDGRAGSIYQEWDVDGGRTTLLSPTLDLLAADDPVISYHRWYSNDTGAASGSDLFRVDISNDGGQVWQNVETVGPSGPGTSGGWIYHQFKVADFVTPTQQTILRFIASDEGANSLVEAAVDDFKVFAFGCDADCPQPADGDMNGDGNANGADIQGFVAGFLGTPSSDDLCHGDFTDDDLINEDDIAGFVAVLLAP